MAKGQAGARRARVSSLTAAQTAGLSRTTRGEGGRFQPESGAAQRGRRTTGRLDGIRVSTTTDKRGRQRVEYIARISGKDYRVGRDAVVQMNRNAQAGLANNISIGRGARQRDVVLQPTASNARALRTASAGALREGTRQERAVGEGRRGGARAPTTSVFSSSRGRGRNR